MSHCSLSPTSDFILILLSQILQYPFKTSTANSLNILIYLDSFFFLDVFFKVTLYACYESLDRLSQHQLRHLDIQNLKLYSRSAESEYLFQQDSQLDSYAHQSLRNTALYHYYKQILHCL